MSTSSLWLPNVILLVQGLNLWLGKQNFLILTLCVYLIKKRFSQFLSHWELAEPVFCIEELNYLPYKNKSLVLWREIQNGAWWEFILRVSFTGPPLCKMINMLVYLNYLNCKKNANNIKIEGVLHAKYRPILTLAVTYPTALCPIM